MAETTFKTFLVAVFSWLMLISSANALNLKSNVIILLDLSNSYFTPDRMEDRIKDNIDQLSELIANKKDGPKDLASSKCFLLRASVKQKSPYASIFFIGGTY